MDKRSTRLLLIAVGILLLAAGRPLFSRLSALVSTILSLKVRERTVERPVSEPAPKGIPPEAKVGARPLQLTSDGTGPLYHRRYRVDIVNAETTPQSLMKQVQANLDNFCPPHLVRFEKTKGEEIVMQVGDEYYIHIMGPWDGPVRVIDVTPTSFSLVTLEDHLEAGEIIFNLAPHPTRSGALRFEITSWARSRDMLVDLAYNKAKIAKAMQTSMWAHFCTRVAEQSGGQILGDIDVLTEESPFREEVIPGES